MYTTFENSPESHKNLADGSLAKVISFELFDDRDIIVLLDENLNPIMSTTPIKIIRSAAEEADRQAAKSRHPAFTKSHPDLVLQ